ncbi:MAG: YkgJ family cysteine cluster protein [Armatimonadota bacterium]
MAADDAILSSAEADPERMLARAKKLALFDGLRRIYAGFPRTTCENCARCCFESPGLFYIEHLALLDALSAAPAPRREGLIRRAFRELFFSWIEPDRTCIFLESQRCTIYDRRPLACRLFGLVPAPDRDAAEAQARLAAREEARRLSRFGIRVPEAVIRRSLASCDKVRDARGKPIAVNGEALASRVAKLDAALIPQQVVIEEFCFRSLPERLGAAAFGEQEVSTLRLQLLRRAQAGEPVNDLLKLALAQSPPFRLKGSSRTR